MKIGELKGKTRKSIKKSTPENIYQMTSNPDPSFHISLTVAAVDAMISDIQQERSPYVHATLNMTKPEWRPINCGATILEVL